VARSVVFIAISRPGHVYEIPPGVRLLRLDTVELRISSSDIRAALAAGRIPEGVPAPVLDYIFERGLYGSRVPA
jgi:nicotinic acid mononucleotide adenylyltransferase